MHKFKRTIFKIIDPDYAYKGAGRVFNVGMLILIFLNVLAVITETEEVIYLRYKSLFDKFELFSIIIFTAEYAVRLWTCTEHEKYKSSILGRIKFATTPSMLIDLISFLPFYIPLGDVDLRIIRAVRLFRLFRLFKMGRYSKSLVILANVIKTKKEELVITLFSGGVLLVIAASIMYFIEREAQPDLFGSILDAIWWGAATLTSITYENVYPITLLGKFMGLFIAVIGIGLFALPAGIIASGFASELQKQKAEKIICPHCGKDINTSPKLHE